MVKNVFFFVVIVLAGPTWAATYSGGTGTEADPYQIATTADWLELIDNEADWAQGTYFILTADIDFEGAQITPVGNFSGVLDGNGYVVHNFVINLPNRDYVGLFGRISGGQIRSLGAEDFNIAGRDIVGGLCGSNEGIILASYATGSVAGNQIVGGLCGRNQSFISNSYAAGNVVGGSSVGGLIGENRSVITDCYAAGLVTGEYRVGGLCGLNSGSGLIKYSHAQGDVSGDYRVGGLCGENERTIEKSYATQNVTGNNSVGGLCGKNRHFISFSYSTATVTASGEYAGGLCGWNRYGHIRYSYAMGDVAGSDYVGGLVGLHDQGQVFHCYSTGSPTGNDYVGGLCGYHGDGEETGNFWDMESSQMSTSAMGTGKTTEQMQTAATFAQVGWDFIDTWDICEGNSYPRLRPCYSGGSGTEFNPYQIATTADWLKLIDSPAHWDSYVYSQRYFILTADIDFEGAQITPVGVGLHYFYNVLDGNGHVIRNFGVYQPGTSGVGLFGRIGYSGMISNLGIEDFHIVGNNGVGGLCGTNRGIISGCYATGDVTGNDGVGGLCGGNWGHWEGYATIKNSYATGSVIGRNRVGGLCGDNSTHATITDSYAAGSVTASGDYAGGLCGQGDGSWINNSYAQGQVSGENYVGGLVGAHVGTISDSYATGSVAGISYVGGLCGTNAFSVNDSYATGSVSASGDYVGGLIGRANSDSSVDGSYAEGSVTGNNEVGGLIGRNDGTLSKLCPGRCFGQ